MQSYISKLQSKSENARKRMLFTSLAITMTFVVFIWVYNLGDHFNTKTTEQASSDLNPFSLFADSISNTYQNISASVGSVSSPKAGSTTNQKQIDLIPVEHTKQ